MTKSKASITNNYIFRIGLMLFMILFVGLPVYLATRPEKVDNEIVTLDSGWTVTVDGTTHKNVTLSEFSFELQNRGDKITVEGTLPEDITINNPIIDFYTVHSTLDAYIGDELIYTYGHDLYDENKLLGYGDHFIGLPLNYQGQNIRFELMVTEDEAFDGIKAVSISDGTGLIRKNLSGLRINLLISMFLILFGLIIMLLSMLMLKQAPNFILTFCIALFSFLIGCWTLCNTDLIIYFITDLRVKVFIEYMSFYLAPLPFTLYLQTKVTEDGTPRYIRIIFDLLIAIELLFVAVAFLGQMFGVIHFPKMLKTCHIIMGLALLFSLWVNIRDLIVRKDKEASRSIVFGFLIACIVVAFELIRFNYGKFLSSFSENKYSSTVSIAVLIVIVGFLVDYANGISKVLMENTKKDLLEQLAYMDELTGLGNRRKCEETLIELGSKNIQYSVISLDLNLLKTVNDSEGHDKGDAMLKAFAKILEAAFGSYGTVGRMGGDEFIVIMPGVKMQNAETIIDSFKQMLDDNNKQDNGIPLSTAYGLADSEEAMQEFDAHAAYRLADARMYDNKREYKKNLNKNI